MDVDLFEAQTAQGSAWMAVDELRRKLIEAEQAARRADAAVLAVVYRKVTT